MVLKERYRVHKKHRLKSYIVFVVFVMLLVPKFGSTARFTSDSTTNAATIAAKWNIAINGVTLSNAANETINNGARIIPDNQNKTTLGPGDTGYFDIEIDPNGTEVSVEYTIGIDLSHLPVGTTITSYDVIRPNIATQSYTGNTQTINDTILLSSGQALQTSDKRTYRVHCRIDGNAVMTPEDTFYVDVTINGGQKIS